MTPFPSLGWTHTGKRSVVIDYMRRDPFPVRIADNLGTPANDTMWGMPVARVCRAQESISTDLFEIASANAWPNPLDRKEGFNSLAHSVHQFGHGGLRRLVFEATDPPVPISHGGLLVGDAVAVDPALLHVDFRYEYRNYECRCIGVFDMEDDLITESLYINEIRMIHVRTWVPW